MTDFLNPVLFMKGQLRLNLNFALRKGVPPNFSEFNKLAPSSSRLSGVSRDSTGAALAGCTCDLFKVTTNGSSKTYVHVGTTVSDGSGNYSFNVGNEGPFRVTFDLDGAPIRAGITLNTLGGV